METISESEISKALALEDPVFELGLSQFVQALDDFESSYVEMFPEGKEKVIITNVEFKPESTFLAVLSKNEINYQKDGKNGKIELSFDLNTADMKEKGVSVPESRLEELIKYIDQAFELLAQHKAKMYFK